MLNYFDLHAELKLGKRAKKGSTGRVVELKI